MKISRRYADLAGLSVAQVATEFPASIAVLNRYRLDYCCNGKRPLETACRESRLNYEAVCKEIQKAIQPGGGQEKYFDMWDTSRLLDFIEQHHHHYVRTASAEIMQLLHKVCNAHGHEHEFLFDLKEHFCLLVQELLSHLEREEKVLFPGIRRLVTSGGSYYLPATAHPFDQPIMVMESEHDDAGRMLKYMRTITNNYTLPEFACLSFQHLYKLLTEFDTQLMEHIHLENNILFSRVKTPVA